MSLSDALVLDMELDSAHDYGANLGRFIAHLAPRCSIGFRNRLDQFAFYPVAGISKCARGVFDFLEHLAHLSVFSGFA